MSMKNRMKNCFFLFFMLIATVSCAQQKHDGSQDAARYKGAERFEAVMEKYMNARVPDSLHKLCITSSSFVRFQVNEKGEVVNVVSNFTTPASLSQFFVEAIQSTNGKWLPQKANGKAVISRSFLLPIVYNLSSGCKSEKNNHGKSVYNMLRVDAPAATADGIFVNELSVPFDGIVLSPIFLMGKIQ